MRAAITFLQQRPVQTLAGCGLMLLVLATLPPRLATGDPDGGTSPTAGNQRPGLLEIEVTRLGPRLQEVRTRLESEQRELDALRAAFRRTTDPDEARVIRTRMREIKTATETAVLQIQLEHAQDAGNRERAKVLESLLEAELAPRNAAEAGPIERRRLEGSR